MQLRSHMLLTKLITTDLCLCQGVERVALRTLLYAYALNT